MPNPLAIVAYGLNNYTSELQVKPVVQAPDLPEMPDQLIQ